MAPPGECFIPPISWYARSLVDWYPKRSSPTHHRGDHHDGCCSMMSLLPSRPGPLTLSTHGLGEREGAPSHQTQAIEIVVSRSHAEPFPLKTQVSACLNWLELERTALSLLSMLPIAQLKPMRKLASSTPYPRNGCIPRFSYRLGRRGCGRHAIQTTCVYSSMAEGDTIKLTFYAR